MAGLGLFLYGALKAVTGIGKAVDNHQMKNYSYKIDEKGRPTWIDRVYGAVYSGKWIWEERACTGN